VSSSPPPVGCKTDILVFATLILGVEVFLAGFLFIFPSPHFHYRRLPNFCMVTSFAAIIPKPSLFSKTQVLLFAFSIGFVTQCIALPR